MIPLRTWTIYKSPSDYPGLYVVREFTIENGFCVAAPRPRAVVHRLDLARAVIPANATCVGRQLEDDPVIVETWM